MPERSVQARMAGGRVWRWLAGLLLWLLVAGIGVVVLLPADVLAWMRNHWTWFNLPMLWIEHARLPFNLVHVILFAGLGALVRLAFPRVRPWREAWLLVLFAAATELVQLWVPGRHARWSDFWIDLAAALAGMLVAVAVARVLPGSGRG